MSPSVTVRLLATQSDARLVDLARQGHERAFEALVQRYRRPLLAYCRRALLPEARAEDALQQALLQAWLALQRGDEVRDARAWLYRIVHNTTLNALRGSGYDYAELSEALSGAGAPQEDLDRRIAVREALAGLAALPPQQREALLRTAVEGASHADAAAEMGLSEGALRGLVYRARATLRTAATAITPMPFASWAAGAAGHGAVAELAVGGGSAGLAGLVAKGGAVAVTAGVLALGAGTVEHARHAHRGGPARSHAARVHTAGADLTAATPVAATVQHQATQEHPNRPRLQRREPILAPAERERAPEATVHPRDGGRGEDGGGTSPRRNMTGGDHGGRGDGGDGSESGGRQGQDRPPDSQLVPTTGSDDGGSSGSDGGSSQSGTSGSSGSSSSGDGSGSFTSGSGDDTSNSGTGDSSGDGSSGSGSGSGSGDYINGSASPR